MLDAAYHGHTTTMMDLSAYKHEPDSSEFPKPWVHVVPTPDTYRGKHTGPDAVDRYAEEVAAAVAESAQGGRRGGSGRKGREKGKGVAAFFAEGVLACGGQVWGWWWGVGIWVSCKIA